MNRAWSLFAGVVLLGSVEAASAWVVSINGTGGDNDQVEAARAIAVDAAGDVVAAGQLNMGDEFFRNYHFVVTKRSAADGSEVWTKLMNHLSGTVSPGCTNFCGARAVQVDALGGIVAGGSMKGEFADEAMTVVKMSGADGSVLWGTELVGFPMSLDGNGVATDLTLDAAGDVFVAGEFLTGYDSLFDFVVARLDGSTGLELWRYVLDGSGSASDLAFAVSLDPNGDVVAAGYTRGASSSIDMTVVKLDGDTGALLWPAPVVVATDASGIAQDVAVDSAGDVLVTGYFFDFVTFDREFIVVKLAGDDGSEQWRHDVAGTDAAADGTGIAVVVDATDDVLAAGTVTNMTTGQDFTVAKVAGASGDEIWRAEVDGGTSSVAEIANAIRLGDSGQVIAAGTLAGPTGVPDVGVVSLSASTGAQLAVHVIEGTGEEPGESSQALAIATGPDGRVALAAQLHQHHLDGDNVDFSMVQFSDRLLGRKLLVTDGTSGQRFSIKAVDSNVLATPGDPGDPMTAGATLELRNPASAKTATFTLPASMWKRKIGRTAGANTYIYKDPDQIAGPCRVVKLVSGRKMSVNCRGLNGFTLDEASQGALETRLVIGGHPRFCLRFAAPIHDEAGRFESKNQPAPPSCS